eukprot:TRINITY_DN7927_c0_g1_i2.p1 TRINITY_DN7927_c0_g1~~TRINITY_DN7927_c0_g1_i2.p1  ORF type:complete len:259 (-),score=46.50 TRINITY_DN7927_c0_g1_i2:118-795(-)
MYLDTLREFALQHRLALWVDVEPRTADENKVTFIRKDFKFPDGFLRDCDVGRQMVFVSSFTGSRNFTFYHQTIDSLLSLGGNDGGNVGDDGGNVDDEGGNDGNEGDRRDRGCVIQTVAPFLMPNNPIDCILDKPLEDCRTEKVNPPWELVPGVIPSKRNHHLLNPNEFICSGAGQVDPCYYYRGPVPIYRDTKRLTKEFLRLITPNIFSKLEEIPCVQRVVQINK